MPPPAPTPSPQDATDAIVAQETGALLSRAVGLRAIVAPVLMSVALLIAAVDPEAWRRVVMGGAVAIVLPLALASAWLGRRTGQPPRFLALNLLVMVVFQLVLIGCTGGLVSPGLVIMLPLTAMMTVILGRRAEVAAAVSTQILGVLALAILQTRPGALDLRLHALREGPPPGPVTLWTLAAFATWALIVTATMGTSLRQQHSRVVRRAIDAQGEQVAMWRAWSQELQSVGAELAHEIKNPLASIKGLSALLARDVEAPRGAERLDVLRGEIDRMATLVDELLTYARPLSPLASAPVGLGQLCRRVAAAHEGVAAARGVRLVVDDADPVALGDAHKLAQVLVNLVQNALDVAPPGSTIRLRAGGAEGALVVDVDDEGPGLHPDVAERWSSPGVTTRPDGAGLGLTVALGIARQHGGDLTLRPRRPSGLQARLRLPLPAEPA